MRSLFPFADIQGQLTTPVELQQYALPEYDDILRLKAGSITALALNVWNRIVHGDRHNVDPQAISRYISFPHDPHDPEIDPRIVAGIEDIIGERVIHDMSYSCCRIRSDPSVGDEPVAELLVAHVHPNDLHWADVQFRNPYKPIRPADRRFHYRKYKGFGLLPKVVANIEEFARQKAMDYITLTAAHEDLVPLFGKYGFRIEENKMGQMARAMEKRLIP